ncbi:hypothetical protein Bca101_025490 [Brassica carinata]
MLEFPILSLPQEIQVSVVERVAANSFVDLYRVWATCKSLCALSCFEDRLLRRCYDAGNPSTFYIKGVEYFYRLDRQEEGLALLKSAADAGYEEELFSLFSRQSVGQIGMVARSSHGGWNLDHNAWFITKREEFISAVDPMFRSCPCSPILDQDWDLLGIEQSKAEDMCNRCFWLKEVGIFLRDFSPTTGFPSFDAW